MTVLSHHHFPGTGLLLLFLLWTHSGLSMPQCATLWRKKTNSDALGCCQTLSYKPRAIVHCVTTWRSDSTFNHATKKLHIIALTRVCGHQLNIQVITSQVKWHVFNFRVEVESRVIYFLCLQQKYIKKKESVLSFVFTTSVTTAGSSFRWNRWRRWRLISWSDRKELLKSYWLRGVERILLMLLNVC